MRNYLLLTLLLAAADALAQSRFTAVSAGFNNSTTASAGRFIGVTGIGTGLTKAGENTTTNSSRFNGQNDFVGTFTFTETSPAELTLVKEVTGDISFATRFTPVLVGGIQPNAGTGRLEQRIRLSHNWPQRIKGATVIVSGLPPGVDMIRESGRSNSIPFLEYSAIIPPAASLELLLEFTTTTGDTSWTPTIIAVPNDGSLTPGLAGRIFSVNRVTPLANSNLQVEFNSVRGAHYQILYSNDLSNWQLASVVLEAMSELSIWEDPGAPITDDTFRTSGRRFYRVVQRNP